MLRGRTFIVAVAVVLMVAGAPPAVGGDPAAAAEAAYGSGDFETAFHKARRAIRQDPDHARAHYIAGASALELDEVDDRQAKAHLERCLELRPDTPLAHLLLGVMAVRDAEARVGEQRERERRLLYESAARHFEAELALQPGFLKALAGRAIALRRAGGEIGPVVQAHDAWIAAAPQAFAPYLSLAQAHLASEDPEGAFAVANRVPEQPPHLRSRFLLDLAVECHRQGLNDGIDRAIEALGPETAGSWAGLGRVLLHLSRREESDATEALVSVVQKGLTDEMVDALSRLLSAVSRKSFERVVAAWTPTPEPLKSGSWTQPERVEHVFPEYPEPARKAGIEAEVFMLVVIGTDGTPKVLRAVSTAPGDGFARSSIDAVERWRYRAATKNGEAAATILVVRTDFTVQ